MAVIINEFEIVAEPAPPPAAEAPAAAAPPASPTPYELERVLRRQNERSERVRAH